MVLSAPSSLAVGIMSVEERRAHRERLAQRIGGEVHTYVDVERRGCWHAWRSTWRLCALLEPQASHIAVLADDLAVCADFRATLERLVDARPTAVIAGWMPRDQVEIAHDAALQWASTTRLDFAQCLVLPRAFGNAAVRCIADNELQHGALWERWDDARLQWYCARRGETIYVPVPNICDHLGGDGTIASTVGHVFAPESARARVWLGETGRGTDIDWSDLRAIGDQPVHPYAQPRLLLTPFNARADEVQP